MKTRINAHCLPILALVVVIISGVTSQIVEFTGERNVNGTYGGNVTITWNTRANVDEKLGLHIIAGDSNGTILLSEFVSTSATSQNTGFSRTISTLNIVNRVFARYASTGIADSDGKVIGQVLFTITNLKFSDEGSYTIAEGLRKPFTINTQTDLFVYYGPEQCGTPLNSEYTMNSEENLVVSIGRCGKPRPIVTCKLDGKTYKSVNVTEVNLYNYTYTIVIPTNLKPCGKKQLSCTATGYGEPVVEHATIRRNFTEEKRISGGVCAGHIVGFEVGVILLCVLIYVYLVVWGATKEAGKLAGFIIAVVAGAGFIIGFAVAYGALRNTSENDDCNEDSIALKVCDNAFIAMGVIDFIVLLAVTLVSVKLLKDFGTKPSDQPADPEKTPLKTKANKSSKGENVKAKDSSSRDEQPRTEV